MLKCINDQKAKLLPDIFFILEIMKMNGSEKYKILQESNGKL